MSVSLIFTAIIYGIVEGVTEWLPISSTGHIILLREFLPIGFDGEFAELFEFAVQLGAILAVVLIYSRKFLPERGAVRKWFSLWSKVAVAIIPAALVGVGADKLLIVLTGRDIDGLFFNPLTVGTALIVYGIAFILVERANASQNKRVNELDGISYPDAWRIGLFQALSVIPGTSRSGATILGGMMLGLDRRTSAEFSFLLAVPVMVGACAVKALKVDFSGLSSDAWAFLSVGCVTAFVISLCTVKILTGFLKKHGFSGFGVYRIVLGLMVLIYFLCKAV